MDFDNEPGLTKVNSAGLPLRRMNGRNPGRGAVEFQLHDGVDGVALGRGHAHFDAGDDSHSAAVGPPDQYAASSCGAAFYGYADGHAAGNDSERPAADWDRKSTAG